MILPFSTQFKDGTPTHFIQKIWSGLFKSEIQVSMALRHYRETKGEFARKNMPTDPFEVTTFTPKLHTIRQDPHDRWHEGSLIHPVVFNRSKNQFQFAPTLICKSTQKIEIINRETYQLVKVDGHILYEKEVCGFILDQKFKDLVRNDGFNTNDQAAAFFAWFNKDFSGKIIHWTDLKY